MVTAPFDCLCETGAGAVDALENASDTLTAATCVIVNPAAGRGRAREMIPAITAAFPPRTDLRISSSAGQEKSLAEDAIGAGVETLVVAGGDGTVSNVASAILHSGRDIRLGVIPAGTGDDFAKLLGVTRARPETIARLCATAAPVRVDAARVEDVYFINCCGFGFDVAVLQGIRDYPRLRGSLLYVYTAVANIFSFAGMNTAIILPHASRPTSRHLLIAVANAEYFGGTFRIAPGASARDGKLDVIAIEDVPLWRRPAVLVSALLGRHERTAACSRDIAAEVTLRFDDPPVYDADGELHRAKSRDLTITSCPLALSVVAAPGSKATA